MYMSVYAISFSLQFGMINPFATADANMRQYLHFLQWYAGSKRVNSHASGMHSLLLTQ